MSIVVVTPNSPRVLKDLFRPQIQVQKPKRRKKVKGYIHRFRVVHRPPTGKNGPGRRHKRR